MIKKYIDEVIFCPNRFTAKELFHYFSFLTNRLAAKVFFHRYDFLPNRLTKEKYFHSLNFITKLFSKKKYFQLNNFLSDRLIERISNRASKKSSDLMWSKIKIVVNHFFAGSITLNFYKSIAQFFVILDKQQRKYFGHVVFLPSQCTTKEQNDYVKKLNKIVLLNAINACFLEPKNR